MEPSRALAELRSLREQAKTDEVRESGPAHKAWKAKVDAIMRAALADDSPTLLEFRDLRYHLGMWTGSPGEAERDARYFASRVGDAAALVDAAIYQLELVDDSTGTTPGKVDHVAVDGPIFVVHGREDGRKYELMRVLDRTVDRGAIVLHEQPNRGATLLEKFERHAQTASFAVVLLTGDDEGRLRGDDTALAIRGRQNVILELGVFIGLLGRSRVVVLKDPDVDEPSDLDGLVYIPLDAAGAWRHGLLKELADAGIKVDFARMP
jgi:hypothetical protein